MADTKKPNIYGIISVQKGALNTYSTLPPSEINYGEFKTYSILDATNKQSNIYDTLNIKRENYGGFNIYSMLEPTNNTQYSTIDLSPQKNPPVYGGFKIYDSLSEILKKAKPLDQEVFTEMPPMEVPENTPENIYGNISLKDGPLNTKEDDNLIYSHVESPNQYGRTEPIVEESKNYSKTNKTIYKELPTNQYAKTTDEIKRYESEVKNSKPFDLRGSREEKQNSSHYVAMPVHKGKQTADYQKTRKGALRGADKEAAKEMLKDIREQKPEVAEDIAAKFTKKDLESLEKQRKTMDELQKNPDDKIKEEGKGNAPAGRELMS